MKKLLLTASLILIGLLYFSIVANAQVNFKADPACVATGGTVNFSDNSSSSAYSGDPITEWLWTFPGGNPATSSLQNPTVIYNTDGAYDVTLSIYNPTDGWFDTQTYTAYIKVGDIVVSFTAVPTCVAVGGTVVFTDQSSNAPTTWAWTFAGGTPGSSNAQNPSIVYNTAGVYDVELTAGNICGSNILTKTSYISVGAPIVNLGPDVIVSCASSTVLDAGNGAPGTTYSWSTAITTQTILVTTSGTYSVVVTNCNGSASDIINVTINNSATPAASFTVASACVAIGGTVAFTDKSTNTPTKWAWTFAGGTPATSTVQNPSVIYNTAGIYKVILTVTNICGSNTLMQSNYITVGAPIVNLGTSGTVSCIANYLNAGNPLVATNPGATYLWSTGATTQTIWPPASGTYSVVVTNCNGCVSATIDISIDYSNCPTPHPHIAGGTWHSFALCPDSTVRTWGGGGGGGFYNVGQLGDNTTIDRYTPVQVHGPGNIGFLTGITALQIGESEINCYALRYDGTVWNWGYNLYAQLGDNTTTNRLTPVQVLGPGGISVLSGIVSVAAGDFHALALKNDGTVWAWGSGYRGQYGDGTTTDKLTPVQVHGPGNLGFLTGITAIAAGGDFNLALRNDGTVWAWGWNQYGQLGDNSQFDRYTPVQVHGPGNIGLLTGITAISAGDAHSIALKNDGTVWAWGDNEFGQLGVNTNTGVNTLTNTWAPVQVHGFNNVGFLTGINAISAGDSHCLVLKNDTVVAWGWNINGQLGDNTSFVDKYTPLQVHGPGNVGILTGIIEIAAADRHSVAYKNDGTVWDWGYNSFGGLGDNTTVNRSTPVQVQYLCSSQPVVLTASITAANINCNGKNTGSASVTAEGGTPNYTYYWSPSGETTAIVTDLAAGTYTVVVIDAAADSVTLIISITEPPVLSTTITVTNINCNGASTGSATANISGGNQPYNYFWQPTGKSTSTITELSAGTYTIIVTDANGCIQTTSITINQPTAITLTVTSIPETCSRTCDGSATAGGTGGSMPYTFLWSNDSTSSIINNLCFGVYSVTVTDNAGCLSTAAVTVFTLNTLTVTASGSTTIQNGQSTSLAASGGLYYQWNPATGLNCTTCQNPIASPTATTRYCVTVTDINGCSDSTCVTVNVEIECGELFIPTAFSPNADNNNDCFRIYGTMGCFKSFYLAIFDRWGEKTFTTNDPTECWDGMYQNKELATGIFVYYLQATTLKEEEINKRGNISLIR